MQEPARAHTIRAYVGFNSEPLYQTGRAEMAPAEFARTGRSIDLFCCLFLLRERVGSTTG
jgi:hypothetical protein